MVLRVLIAIVSFAITMTVNVASGQEINPTNDTARRKAEEKSVRLRKKALDITPTMLKLQPETDDEVYGVVMDWGMGADGTNTLVSSLTGDASMYFSSGGGMIGGIKHENVKKAAIKYVRKAQQFLPKGTITEPGPPEVGDYVRFYLLTNKGIYTVRADMQQVEDKTWELLPLFYEAQHVITEYRKVMR